MNNFQLFIILLFVSLLFAAIALITPDGLIGIGFIVAVLANHIIFPLTALMRR